MTFTHDRDHEELADLLTSLLADSGCVLFDFDGPICDLFASRPAFEVARRLRRYLGTRDLRDGSVVLNEPHSPIAVLRDVALQLPGAVVGTVDGMLRGEELRAVAGAAPTPYAKELLEELVRRNYRLAITTNNSVAAVKEYLRARGLGKFFGGRIYGRTGEPAHMKPKPDCLLKAARDLGVVPKDCLMIGDSVVDLEAARDAGTKFVGFCDSVDKKRALEHAEPRVVTVHSLREVLEALP